MIKNLKLYERVLIVVDMVNGFVDNGPLHDIECSKIIPRQKEIIDDYLDNGDLVVFIKDTHTYFNSVAKTCIRLGKQAAKESKSSSANESYMFDSFDDLYY